MTAILVIAFLGGFHGGRDVALSQLRSCWEEGGIQARPISGPAGPVMVVQKSCVRAQAPFAGMVLIGFCVDISSFLGELRAERDDRQKHAKEILDWAMLGLRLAGHEMGTI